MHKAREDNGAARDEGSDLEAIRTDRNGPWGQRQGLGDAATGRCHRPWARHGNAGNSYALFRW